jgi:hypothetical protein
MGAISDSVKRQLADSCIETYFVSGAVTKWWNAQRADKKQVIALLGGWYWSDGRQEVGPFRTVSAALRDAYYRRVVRQRVPLMDKSEVEAARMELSRPPPKTRKPRRSVNHAAG